MTDILLTTINARYIHAAFGLRYLRANLGELMGRAEIVEFEINQRALEIVEAIVAREPRIVGMGVYIWNVTLATEVVALLKRLRPEVVVILGGPEVSHETEGQEIVRLADHVITGEADVTFAEVCRALLAGSGLPKIIVAELPALEGLALPYELVSRGRSGAPGLLRGGVARVSRSRASSACRRWMCRCGRLRWSRSWRRWSGCWRAGRGSSSSSIARST